MIFIFIWPGTILTINGRLWPRRSWCILWFSLLTLWKVRYRKVTISLNLLKARSNWRERLLLLTYFIESQTWCLTEHKSLFIVLLSVWSYELNIWATAFDWYPGFFVWLAIGSSWRWGWARLQISFSYLLHQSLELVIDLRFTILLIASNTLLVCVVLFKEWNDSFF